MKIAKKTPHKKSYNNYGVYTMFNFGTPHSFNPNKRVIDYYTNKERTLLQIHLEKVKEANHPLVHILDNHGDMVHSD